MGAILDLNNAHNEYLDAARRILSMEIDFVIKAKFAEMQGTTCSKMQETKDYLESNVKPHQR